MNRDLVLGNIKALIGIAMADGRLDDNERNLILQIADKSGISAEEVQYINENMDIVEWKPADNRDDKIQQLREMVWVMCSDGEIDENEEALCRVLALGLGFDPEAVDVLIAELLVNFKVWIDQQALS